MRRFTFCYLNHETSPITSSYDGGGSSFGGTTDATTFEWQRLFILGWATLLNSLCCVVDGNGMPTKDEVGCDDSVSGSLLLTKKKLNFTSFH